MDELLKGNHEWREHVSRNRELFEKLSFSQNPKAAVFSCSDSRVIPEKIFSSPPGELFVHRNIANIFSPESPSAKSFLGYALKHLKIKNILVLGHYSCGGIKGLTALEELESGLQEWLKQSINAKEVAGGENLDAVSEANALLQCKKLLEILLVKESNAKVFAWFYDLKTGKVFPKPRHLSSEALKKMDLNCLEGGRYSLR